MLAGGLLYTAGALSYHGAGLTPLRRFSATTRSFTLPCAAAACQYTAIALFIA